MNKKIITDATLKTTRLIWGSMFMSLGLFAIIPMTVPAHAKPVPDMLYLFAGLSLMDVAMSFAIPWIMFGKPLKEHILPPQKVNLTFQSTRIIAFALAESIGIFGFVLYFLGEPPLVTHLFVALATVILALHFPRQPRLD